MKKILFFLLPALLLGCGMYEWKEGRWTLAQHNTTSRENSQKRAEFSTNCQSYLNSTAKETPYLSALYAKDITWPSLIQSMRTLIEEISKGKGRLVNPSKNNMLLNALLIDDLSTRKAFIHQFLTANRAFSKDSCYVSLEEQNEKLGFLREEIEDYSYTYEQNLFKKKTGYVFSNEGSVIDFISTTFGRGTPSKGVLYGVNNVRVLQSVPGGVLFVLDTSGTYMVDVGIGYLATTKHYADGAFIHGLYAEYTGLKQYNTVLGANKQIYGFKVVNTNPFAKILSGFYFYPEEKGLTVEQALPKLITRA